MSLNSALTSSAQLNSGFTPGTYQAIVFDFDGTAIPNARDGHPSRRVMNAIKRAQAAGFHCIGATGRPLDLAAATAHELGLIDPVIICGGTAIYSPTKRRILSRQVFAPAVLTALATVIPAHRTIAIDTATAHITAAPEQLPIHQDASILYLVLQSEAEAQRIAKVINSLTEVVCTIAAAWNGGHVLNITPVLGTKEHAVAEILTQLGISAAKAIGVGDGGNDIHLFQTVGLKVAMGNAVAELKSAADHITASVADDGLALVIEDYLLSGTFSR